MKEDLKRELAYTMEDPVFRDVKNGEDARILALDIRRRLLPMKEDDSTLAIKINDAVLLKERLLFEEGEIGDEMARETLKSLMAEDQPFGILLQRPEFALVMTRLQEMHTAPSDSTPTERAANAITLRALLRELISPDMACRNSLIADFNIILSGCASCNTCVISMGAGAASKGVSMYTAKYMGKDAVNIKDAAVVLADAANHVKEYVSTADNSGTSTRTAQHLAQRIINKSSIELEASQAAGVVLGVGSSNGSDTLSYHSCWDVLRLARLVEFYGSDFKNYNFKPEDSTADEKESEQEDSDDSRDEPSENSSGMDDFIATSEDDSEDTDIEDLIGRENRHTESESTDNDGDESTDNDGDESCNDGEESCNTGSEHLSDSESIYDTTDEEDIYDDSDCEEDILLAKPYYGFSKVYRDENDDPIVISEAYHYLWRDSGLDHFNFRTFSLLFCLRKMTSADKKWFLENQSPLPTTADEDTTAPRGRRPQPRYVLKNPHPLRNSHILVKNSKWGIFAFAGRPPPREPRDPGPEMNTAKALSYKRRLKKYAHFYCATYIPFSTTNPPVISTKAWLEHVSTLEETACLRSEREDDGDDDKYKQRMVACGELYTIENAKTGFQECKAATNLTAKHRFRSRDLWESTKKPMDFSTVNSTAQERAAKIVSQMQESAARLRGTKSLTTRLTAATKVAAWKKSIIQALPSAAINPSSRPQKPGDLLKKEWKAANSPQHRTGTTVDYDLAKEMEILTSPPPPSPGSLFQTQQNPRLSRFARASNIQVETPPELHQMTEEEYAKACEEYIERVEIERRGGESAGDPPLNPEQRAAGEPYMKMILIRRDGIKKGAKPHEIAAIFVSETLAPVMLLTGAGGTGKSALIHTIMDLMKTHKCGHLLVTAYTGVAAAPFGGPTVLRLLGFGINTKDHSFVKQLNPQEVDKLRRKFKDECGVEIDDIGGIVIDEVSFNQLALFGHIDGRLRQLMRQPNLPCGGIPLLLCGDNHQKAPPAAPMTWYQELVQHAMNPAKGPYKYGPTTARAVGHRLLVQARRYNLTKMMRAKNDPEFQECQEKMRDTSSPTPISESFVRKLQPVSITDVQDDEGWLFAPVGVLSKIERDAINISQLKTFAKHFDLPLVKWKLPMYDIVPDPDVRAGLYENEENLFGYFVEGAPVHMTETIKSVRKLVNGTPGLFDSLVLSDDAETTKIQTASTYSF